MSFTVNELCSSKIKGVLKDENDNGIDTANVSALTVTLYDDVTEAIINSRDHLNILNVNGGSVDSQGNFSWLMSPSDNPILNDSLGTELHHALIEFTYTGGKQGKKVVDIGVVNLVKVPQTFVPPPVVPIGVRVFKALLQVRCPADGGCSILQLYQNDFNGVPIFNSSNVDPTITVNPAQGDTFGSLFFPVLEPAGNPFCIFHITGNKETSDRARLYIFDKSYNAYTLERGVRPAIEIEIQDYPL